jgi:hypothetical protein
MKLSPSQRVKRELRIFHEISQIVMPSEDGIQQFHDVKDYDH